jgi:RNA polymerase sigma-70 factor, ECF subfamily
VIVAFSMATSDVQAAVAATDQLARAIRTLPTEQRATLALVYYLDLPQDEAARVLGVPTGTVKSRLHRAVESLRAELDAETRDTAMTRQESIA